MSLSSETFFLSHLYKILEEKEREVYMTMGNKDAFDKKKNRFQV